MSVARRVPETWHLTGDDARETLLRTGRRQLLRDAFVRLRASDGFSHARSLAFALTLLMVQALIVLEGFAAALDNDDVSATIVRSIREVVPGPAGETLTDTVFHAYRTGASGQYLVLALVSVTTLVTGATFMGQIERALNRQYGIEQDRPSVQKYARATILALTAGVLAAIAFAAFALGHSIGESIDSGAMRDVWRFVRWPLALLLMIAATAMLFLWAPRRRQPAWSWLAYGAAISVVLWGLCTLGLALFFESSTTFSRTYGPLAGMIALLLWALLTSISLLFGAAIAVQLEAVRAGVAEPRDEHKAEVGDDDTVLLRSP